MFLNYQIKDLIRMHHINLWNPKDDNEEPLLPAAVIVSDPGTVLVHVLRRIE